MTNAGFELRRVSKTFGTHCVLTECDLTLPSMQHTALLGVSAGGKSTVLRLIAGLEIPTAGEVLMNGLIASAPQRIIVAPHRRRIAMVFQDLGLWPGLNVIDNVHLALEGSPLSRAERADRALEALDLCRVGDVRTRLPGTLSGGQQQRVALARAVAAEPAFLLLDEPFAGLDLATKTELLDDIKSLARKRRLTMVLVTHDPVEAFTLCEHAAVIEQGRALEHGPWTELLRAPQSAVLRAFRSTDRRYETATNDESVSRGV